MTVPQPALVFYCTSLPRFVSFLCWPSGTKSPLSHPRRHGIPLMLSSSSVWILNLKGSRLNLNIFLKIVLMCSLSLLFCSSIRWFMEARVPPYSGMIAGRLRTLGLEPSTSSVKPQTPEDHSPSLAFPLRWRDCQEYEPWLAAVELCVCVRARRWT